MVANGFVLVAEFPVSPTKLYRAWLSSKSHAAMSGSPANIDPRPGGKFEAWDGYISGTTLELDEGKRIVQAWRTVEFPEAASDSRLELVFEKAGAATRLTLTHSGLPKDQVDDYRQGWEDSYFKPMRRYLGRKKS